MGFEELYRHERAGVLRAVLITLDDSDLALDVTDEAFARVYERWAELTDVGNRPGRVYRVALDLAATASAASRWSGAGRCRPTPAPGMVPPTTPIRRSPGRCEHCLSSSGPWW